MSSTSTEAIECTPALRPVAAKLIWWEPPEESLQYPLRFMAQVMTMGTWDDVLTVRRELGDAWFVRALREPPAGVFDARSWNFWHIRFNMTPTPPLPVRELP